jgi:hypothetical protein
MSTQMFNSPLEIINGKLGDAFTVSYLPSTPYNPELRITNLDGTILKAATGPDTVRNGYYYWFITANSSFGIATALQYYVFELVDESPSLTIPDPNKWILYINDEADFEGKVDRSLMLAGHNIRKFNFIYTGGQVTSFEMKGYSSRADLLAAEAGTSDNFIAHYKVTYTYDSQYRMTQVTSVKQ